MKRDFARQFAQEPFSDFFNPAAMTAEIVSHDQNLDGFERRFAVFFGRRGHDKSDSFTAAQASCCKRNTAKHRSRLCRQRRSALDRFGKTGKNLVIPIVKPSTQKRKPVRDILKHMLPRRRKACAQNGQSTVRTVIRQTQVNIAENVQKGHALFPVTITCHSLRELSKEQSTVTGSFSAFL
jgi:hypothetical protein